MDLIKNLDQQTALRLAYARLHRPTKESRLSEEKNDVILRPLGYRITELSSRKPRYDVGIKGSRKSAYRPSSGPEGSEGRSTTPVCQQRQKGSRLKQRVMLYLSFQPPTSFPLIREGPFQRPISEIKSIVQRRRTERKKTETKTTKLTHLMMREQSSCTKGIAFLAMQTQHTYTFINKLDIICDVYMFHLFATLRRYNFKQDKALFFDMMNSVVIACVTNSGVHDKCVADNVCHLNQDETIIIV